LASTRNRKTDRKPIHRRDYISPRPNAGSRGDRYNASIKERIPR
jgi:hypothetical protein